MALAEKGRQSCCCLTLDMVRAGVDVLLAFDKEWDDPNRTVVDLIESSLAVAPCRKGIVCCALVARRERPDMLLHARQDRTNDAVGD